MGFKLHSQLQLLYNNAMVGKIIFLTINNLGIHEVVVLTILLHSFF